MCSEDVIPDPLTEKQAEEWIIAAELLNVEAIGYGYHQCNSLPDGHSAKDPKSIGRMRFSMIFTKMLREHERAAPRKRNPLNPPPTLVLYKDLWNDQWKS